MNSQLSTLNSQLIQQCARCGRQHDGSGQVRRFVACVPQMADCGLPDCADVVERNRQEDAGRQERRQARCGKPRHSSLVTRHQGHPACPEPPLPRRSVTGPDLNHKDQQRQFVSSGAGSSDCEKMLELLWVGFQAYDPARQSRGEWISSHDLKFVHHIETPNSRASQLRGAESYEPHPLVSKHRLDIDCAVVDGKWSYSVCFIERSERLARERKKEEAAGRRSWCNGTR